ncbi:hypothetical protein [Planococcus alpniumensis]|uniref:hypothetical protein n=1 Tax=Planococcus alpniumensis TaxID=2708345 RepID=UPI001B8B5F29|nr:hypothetical protein [Planococcus sp. MSAK28401]
MKKWISLIALFMLAGCSTQPVQPTEDTRKYTHGVSIIGNSVLWSEKSEEQRKDGWTHDIYKKEIGESQFDTLVSSPEAQEPVSASSTDETTIITYEDGYDSTNNVSQRYKLYDDNWQLLHEGTLRDGGHSGHTASTNAHHVLFWSHGWVNGGGVNDLGSGKEVIVSTVSNEGEVLHEINLSQPDDRDSWPMLAASEDNALLVWQQFNDDASEAALRFAVYDPEANELTVTPTELLPQVDFYIYSVSYVPEAQQYVVAAQTDQGGTLSLLSKEGELLDQITSPRLVREAAPAIEGNTLVFPQLPANYFTVHISDDQLQLNSSDSLDISWGTSGTTGVFLDERRVYFATLNKEGLQEVTVELDEAVQ